MKKVFMLCACATALSAVGAIAPFKDGERVIVLGDSITHGGRFVAASQFLWDLRHPNSNVEFMSAGICGDTAPGGLRRLDWDVLSRKPDRVMVMFGMNDVTRGSLWSAAEPTAKDLARRDEVVARYETNVLAIVNRLREKGVKVDLITPTPYDEYASFQKQKASKGVDSIGLAMLADATRKLAAREGLGLVEFHSVFSPMLRQHDDKKFLADRVHPGYTGHFLMASRIFEEAGADGIVARSEINADGSGARTRNAEISGVDFADGKLAFNYAPKSLPVPLLTEYRELTSVYPITEKLNREILKVKGLAPGAWSLKVSGETLGTFSAEEFEEGVNLALLDTPAQKKSAAAAKFLDELKKTQSRARTVYSFRNNVERNGGDFSKQDSAFAALDRWYDNFKKTSTEHYIKYYGGELKCFKRDYPQIDALNRHEEETREEMARATMPCAPYRITVESVAPKGVPPLFGAEGMTREKWERERRPEILDFFTRKVYGTRTVEKPATLRFESRGADETVYGGLGTKVKMRMVYGNAKGETREVPFTAYLPAKRKGPAPAFLLIAPHDPDAIGERVNGHRPHRMDVKTLLERGYAGVSYKNNDVALDHGSDVNDYKSGIAMKNGVWQLFGPCGQKARGPESWGAISAWAWGASRILDWIETEPRLDAKRVAVVGLSRCGKTALWAGCTDQRFAMAISCCSGCTGAKLNHIDLPKSEQIDRINRVFPHWFAPTYRQWNGRDAEIPFDNHQLVALMAPRLCIVCSASDDAWAGQPGEWWSAKLASPAWELYGKDGLVADAYPAPAVPQQKGNLAYHRRIGPHDQTWYDWARYMDFADAHGWGE